MRIIALLLPVLVLCSRCAGPSADAGDADGQTVHASATPYTNPAPPIPLGGCYEMVLQQDTALLQMNVQDSTVSGDLVYRWHQKRPHSGHFKGVIRDSLIFADYILQSGDSSSVREVVFRIKDSTLQWASGDLTRKEGKVIFSDPASLHFDTIAPFFKIPCRQ